MSIIEQIKAEIERRITDNTFGAKLELIDILAWLDTIESEKPMQEGLEEEVEKCLKQHQMIAVGKRDFTEIARHFAEWGAEHSGDSEIPKDLEEAANNYLDGVYGKMPHSDLHIAIFIAGAKWMEEQLKK